MCCYRFILSLAFSLLFVPGTKAQQSFNYSFRHISQGDGLSHNQVLSVTQDNKGFIWIVTTKGLQRYDGSRFITYPEMLINPAEGLIYNAEMYVDKEDNQLLIASSSALEKMEFGKNEFSVWDKETLIKDPSFAFTSYAGTNKRRWLVNTNAIYYFDSITKKNVFFLLNAFPANIHKSSFIAGDSNYTWVVGVSQLYLFDKKNRQVWSDNFNPSNHPLLQSSWLGTQEKFLRFIMIDSGKNIWVTTWGDLFYKYDNETKTISQYSLSVIKTMEEGNTASIAHPLINCILEDDNHTIWVGTENAGLLRYNVNRDNFDYCVAQERNSESIRYNYKIYSLFQDKEQNIWIGTDKGISIFNPYRQYFKSIRHEENNLLSVTKSELLNFYQTTNGDIYAGTWGGGIAIYDHSFHFKRNVTFTGAYEKNYVWCFLQVNDKTVWMGCQHGYLHVYDIVSNKIQTLYPPEMENSTIRCMEKDNAGNVWFGLNNGKIAKWDNQQQKFTAFKSGSNVAGSVLNIYIDAAQNLWVSTEMGFKQFDPEKMEYSSTWLPAKNNPTSISANTCQGIEEYDDSTLLIGTINGGLNFFNKRTKSFSHLNTGDGLPSNSIYAIKKDTTGYIWFTTEYGLYKCNLAEKRFIPYSFDPGLINSSFMSDRFLPLHDGQWLTFTTAEAISFFPYKPEYPDNSLYKTEITGFKLFDKLLPVDSLLFENKPVRLSYKENFFTIEFASLSFSGQQQTNYYYRLAGIDGDWVKSGTKRFASYTDLKPGEYTFEVKAENGSSSGEATSFKIIIAPPFWQTWWFISASVALIGLSVYWLFRRRINTIHHEAEMKQTIAETEMMALRAQMNPHFIFNCLNAIDNLIQTNQKEKATTYLAKFAKLIRSILDSSKNNVVPFQNDYESLQLYLQMEQFRCSNKFVFELKADEELLNSDYKLPPLIVQPFAENAILHGLLNKQSGDRKLTIAATLENDNIKYTVTDNGVGRSRAEEIKEINKPGYQSYGINITTERIHLYNQNGKSTGIIITDLLENGRPAGTKVEILLKIYDNNK